MRNVIFFVLSNFTLTLLIIGLIFSAVDIGRAQRPLTAPVVVENLFFWFIFFSIGVAYLYNGFFHTVMHEMTAKMIGWADSPFQIELGFASAGLGLVGLIAPWKSFHMRFAVIVPIACFLWGAAGVHIHSMMAEQNFAPGNAGIIFWTDILVPAIGFALLHLQARTQKTATHITVA
jgi:hypothetical protein